MQTVAKDMAALRDAEIAVWNARQDNIRLGCLSPDKIADDYYAAAISKARIASEYLQLALVYRNAAK
jgi:hypothetical protein